MIDLKNINIILTGATGGLGSSILEILNNVNANIIASGTNLIKLSLKNLIFQTIQKSKNLLKNVTIFLKIKLMY